MILLAFALRVYRLDHHNIWGDEAFSIWLSRQALPQVIAGGADTHPPFYPLLLYLWLRLAGDSPSATRFLSVIPGVLLVTAVYALGRRLLGVRAALLAAGLTAAAPFAVYYSQETRMYAWVAALSALSVYAFLRLALQSPITNTQYPIPNPWHLTFALTTLAAIYTHYYAFFILLAQNLFLLWHCRRLRHLLRRWFATQTLLVLAYVPWMAVQTRFLQGKAHTRFEAWGLLGMRDVWIRTLMAFGAGTTVPAEMAWPAMVISAVVGIGLLVLWRAHRWYTPLAALYLLVPLIGAWMVNPIMPFFYERYLIVALPAYLLLLTAGLLWLAGRWRATFAAGLTFIFVVNSYSLYNYYAVPAYAKGGYGNLMAYVEGHGRAGDALLLENPLQRAIYDYYGPKGMPAYWFPPPYPWDDRRTQAQLETITRQHPRLWLVMFGNPAEYDPHHELARWLGRHAFRAYHGDYVDGSLSLFIVGQTEPSIAVDADFGGRVRLVSYGLSTDTLPAGDALQLALEWRALADMDRDYTVFTHLIDTGQRIWAQVDSQPLGGTHPTSVWTPGESIIDRYALQIDPGTPAGTYGIEVGWYDLATMERLPALGANGRLLGDRVLLGPVRVVERR